MPETSRRPCASSRGRHGAWGWRSPDEIPAILAPFARCESPGAPMSGGKRYTDSSRMFDRSQLYMPSDAIRILKQMPGGKFDETVDLAIRLGVDRRKAEQMVRGTVT